MCPNDDILFFSFPVRLRGVSVVLSASSGLVGCRRQVVSVSPPASREHSQILSITFTFVTYILSG